MPKFEEGGGEEGIPKRLWLTRKLWGFASEPPFLHNGRATLISEAILAQCGEDRRQCNAFATLTALLNALQDGKKVYPQQGALSYLANGETGIAAGHFRNRIRNWVPKSLEVEFSSQPNHTYNFNEGDFQKRP